VADAAARTPLTSAGRTTQAEDPWAALKGLRV
jgi:hypothetical protein